MDLGDHMIYRPHLLLNPSRELMVPVPSVGVRGHFTVELIDATSGHVKRTLEFDNLITNAAINFAFGNRGWLNTCTMYCAVGTGSTAPTMAQTGLIAELPNPATNRSSSNGGTADTSGYTAGPPDYVWGQRVRLFTEAQANGNLTEIGFFSDPMAGTMWTRQLFKDGTGTPTTITKTEADQLKITYELRCYPTADDETGTVSISAIDYAYRIRTINVDQNGAWRNLVDFSNPLSSLGTDSNTVVLAAEDNALPSRTGVTLPGFTSQSSYTAAPYTPDSFLRDYTAKFEPDRANYATGIGLLTLFTTASNDYLGLFAMTFAPTKIPKTNTKRLTVVWRETLTPNG